jgi:hypothetical protein
LFFQKSLAGWSDKIFANRRILMKTNKRQLVLNKGSEKFIFRYDSGCEDELLDALIAQARDGRVDFDWFDAAVLSFKLTQSLIGAADELLQNKSPDADLQFNAS